MKRKLIDYGAFEKIKSDSLASIREELDAASELLAEVLDVGSLKIESYGLDGVLFETEDGEFVRADYKMDGGHVQFDNIEQVVLNEETENNKARELISKMIDSLVESDENAAGEMLGEWFAMPRSKRILSEGKKQPSWLVQKRAKAKRMNNLKRSSSEKNSNKSKRSRLKVSSNERRSPIRKTKNGVMSIVGWKKTKKKKMQEWHVLAENVLGFVDYTQNGPDLDSCRVLRKEGDVVGVKPLT
jgi:serine/threonine protein kinase